ncbi:alpha/beta fold hydrolase [Streptacidiphilus sp. P02-A3a]|uniref:alpha/beta fold hydrolase n=1 Tax=Streptacidiphilus sp. P02-A3a TaxID=2704468 RepID=UPI0015F8C0D8|nr:alpha/beta fold hydrolase [Streptacidiphilus sp. P02-A3a]QMU67229.1 alpha/beta fold hydrolase [Streptacidiphilus sp. P02-A3a]
MPRTEANGIELEYETFGDPRQPTLLLVAGLGSQLLSWRSGLCAHFAAHGFHVVRYDNRDSGLSTFLDRGPKPDLRAIVRGDPGSAPYLIADLARDAVGLLDALGVDRAHVAGASMGGMIAQQLAIDHPGRLRSLCSIMSRPGDGVSGAGTREAEAQLSTPRPADRAGAIEAGMGVWRVIGSPGYPEDEAGLRAHVAETYDRSHRVDGFGRQLAAILASPDRTAGLRGVTAPTLVLHGMADPLIDRSGGEATARAVPGAELLLLPGMGHDLPEPLWPDIADAVAANAAQAS